MRQRGIVIRDSEGIEGTAWQVPNAYSTWGHGYDVQMPDGDIIRNVSSFQLQGVLACKGAAIVRTVRRETGVGHIPNDQWGRGANVEWG